MPVPGHFYGFRWSPAPESTILKQISAQLRKANVSMYLVSGAKHSPSSSTGQVVLRTKIPDFSEIWVKWISIPLGKYLNGDLEASF